MSCMYSFVYAFMQMCVIRCYVIRVSVKDGDVVKENVEYDVTHREIPPFESVEHQEVWKDDIFMSQGVPMVTGFLGNSRFRRSAEVNQSTCANWTMSISLTNRMIAVEQGETFHLLCHSCQNIDRDRYEPRQWMKIDYTPDSLGLYHIYEVEPDMYSDQKRNRISLTIDHALTIKRAKLRDAGSYFCRIPVKNENFFDAWLPWNQLQNYISTESHMQYFYHVDVIDINNIETIDVSSGAKNSPLKPENVSDLNIRVDTKWHAWTKCSVCNDEGTRKRIGVCVVKKLDPKVKVKNNYLEHVLRSANDGIPCVSQLLSDFRCEKWIQIPNQFQLEECTVPCPSPKSKRQRRSISASEMKKDIKKDYKVIDIKDKVREGSYLILVCPGSSLLTTPVWVNGTKLLPLRKMKKDPTKRITFDMIGNMHFSKVILSDSGKYSCWIKKKLKRKFEVNVERDNLEDIKKYGLYLLYSFLFDFVVFWILACFKICGRFGQRRRKRSKKNKNKDGDEIADKRKNSKNNAKENKGKKPDLKKQKIEKKEQKNPSKKTQGKK